MIRMLLPAACLLIGGCSDEVSLSDMDCSDVASEAVRISNGALIKISHRRLTKKTDSQIVCHGTGVYSRGLEIPTRFKAYTDSDGDLMIKYDTEEYQDAELTKMSSEMESAYRQAISGDGVPTGGE